MVNAPETSDEHVLIIGGGLVGLVLAQGLKRRGVKATVFERSPNTGGRTEGWAISLHWILNALEQMITPEMAAKLADTTVDGTLQKDEGHFLLIDGRDMSVVIDIPPSVRRVRANRSKLRTLLLEGLDIQYEKRFTGYEITESGVRANFTDGTTVEGSLLVGCDGNNSGVRRQLLGAEKSALRSVGVEAYGGTRHLSVEMTKKMRSIDPLLFQTMNPDTHDFVWFSCQQLFDDGSMECLHVVSHPTGDDELPADASNADIVRDMKRRAANFAEPMSTLILECPEDQPMARISLRDWIPPPFMGAGKNRIALAGDAAGPMTMYRGEGVNHGMLDAALLAEGLLHVKQGKTSIAAALDKYETEVRERRETAVPLSREACLDAHRQLPPKADSPLIGRRAGPADAQRTFDM